MYITPFLFLSVPSFFAISPPPLSLSLSLSLSEKVRLIDIGEARVVDVSQLLELPQHLLAPPANVFEIFVCRTKPADSDPDWPPEVITLRCTAQHVLIKLISK